MFKILYNLIGSFFWRLRGGIWDDWTDSAPGRREVYGIGLGILTIVLYGLWGSWWALLIPVGWYLGSIKGWSQSADIGFHGGDGVKEFLFMSIRGLLVTSPAALFSYLAGMPEVDALRIAFGGSAMGILYFLGQRIDLFPNLAQKIYNLRVSKFFGTTDSHAIAEFIYGFWLGFLISL